jgi:hypothetical protein
MEEEMGRGPGGVKAGQRCRATSSPAHGHHAACVAWCGRDDARGRCAGRPGGSLGWAKREAQAQLSEKQLFIFIFQI